MDQQYPTVAKIPILDTRKFEQWQFWIKQYLQREHYALWEVIEFGDSYEVPTSTASTMTTDTPSGETGKKLRRTVTLTAEDMQKKKNDVKARTTLLLSLPDEHQLQFNKYKTARELWAAILKTFGGNETTKKTKKNFLKQHGSQIKFEDINHIDEDDMEEMDIKWNMALLSMRADKSWNKTGKKISIQGSDVAGFDKSKVYCFNCQKMGHFSRECRAPRSQDRGRKDNYRQGSNAEEQAPKALMAIDGVGWDWSYMENDEDDHELESLRKKGMKVTLLDTQCLAKHLRYIALSNWAHDALLGFSSNNPQDHYSTEVPEGSGNPNPTASTSSPPADQMETLTVETSIPTVSSPVPTAYSTDSQEPSSDARLISKRVANQVETPSLDNILSLTNRFEHILGLTTNSDESNRVAANISNMETAITASRTPTLRIHKDQPKSQIIGPMDTPIQTRNKSKEVEEQKPNKISDALQDPSWVEAMQEELQFKIQNVWTLVDCPKGVRPIGTKWVLKNKKDKRGIVIKNKARLVAQGHTQGEGIDYDEVFAPVARIEAIRLFLAYASFMGFTVYQMDVKSAFLYGTIDEEVYVMQPSGFQDPESPAKVYKVEKAMYGLHQAPRAWYGTLSKYLLKNGFQRGTVDQTLFIRRQRGDFVLVQVYVDDIIFGSTNPQLCREFEALMHEKFQMSAMGDILKKFGYSEVRSSNTPMDKENPWGKDGTGKDTIIATSTTETEYVAAASCCGQVM
nr:hypothetical protein [Tanacetum cinerariifolium]